MRVLGASLHSFEGWLRRNLKLGLGGGGSRGERAGLGGGRGWVVGGVKTQPIRSGVGAPPLAWGSLAIPGGGVGVNSC